MERPKEMNGCPICGSEVKLVIEKKAGHITRNGEPHIYKGDWWVYKCQNKECGDGFTTTESDDISLKHLDVKPIR